LIIDTLRQYIEKVEEELVPYCLVPLLTKASIHTNTAGVFKGFYKKDNIGCFGGKGEYALSRIMKPIRLDIPIWNEITNKYQGETVVIVAHGAVLKVLLLTILQEWSIADWDKFGVIPNVGITELVFNQHWESKRLNEVPHGAPEPAGFVLNG
jgi:hypothetical protein